MAAKIANLIEENNTSRFTISGIDVSYINSLRRTILSDIPIVGIKSSTHKENDVNILINTSRFNNEIVKQRLSCIPICLDYLKDKQLAINKYLLEVDVENTTDTPIIVTTKDFKILNTETKTYLHEHEMKKIFPPFIPQNGDGEYYIDFLRLRPKISDEISTDKLPGERIKLTGVFSLCTAREDGMYNVVGTCSYGFTPDQTKIEEQLEIRKQGWKDEGKKEEEIKFEAKNWKMLEGLRYTIKNSFDFVIESIGIYSNEQILVEACLILIDKLEELKSLISDGKIRIEKSKTTLDNSYDIVLDNNYYAIGHILNFELYTVFYTDLKMLNYVGFKKMHPHDDDSIVRMSISDNTKGISTVKTMLIGTIDTAIKKFKGFKGRFDGTR